VNHERLVFECKLDALFGDRYHLSYNDGSYPDKPKGWFLSLGVAEFYLGESLSEANKWLDVVVSKVISRG